MSDDTSTGGSERLIYHIFADVGVESEALSGYGRVVRVGLDPIDTNESEPVKADANRLPLRPGADLAVLHPPCQKWSKATQVDGDPDDWPDLIPVAREIGKEYAEDYIIENVPDAPLKDPVTIQGRHFGLPIAYARSFETSFPVQTPPVVQSQLPNHLYHGSWTGTKDYWRTLKGYSGDYPSRDLKRSGIPRSYIDFLMRSWLYSLGEQGQTYHEGGELIPVTEGGKSDLSDTDSDRRGDAGDE